jgi:outer membrane protein assembly factor BamB
MQRSRGGGIIEEDASRYLVSLRRKGESQKWSGEVIGSPSLFALPSVTVLAANKALVVFDEGNRKIWEATLNYDLASRADEPDEVNASYGQGPCVERSNALYVFDQGVLTAFDLKSGNVRWRLPSVGITGLFFDERGMMYVNTTTGSPDSIRFSHQINIQQKTTSVVLKVNPANGKILWSAQTGGLVNYVGGKFIYTIQSYAPEEDEDNPYRPETGFETRPHLKIKRLNPRNGHVIWEHIQQRAPIDVEFDKNMLRLVFNKELQVLKCMTW